MSASHSVSQTTLSAEFSALNLTLPLGAAHNRLDALRQRLTACSEMRGRSASDVSLLGLSSGSSIQVICKFVDAGLGKIGETDAKEALKKLPLLRRWFPHLQISFFGPLEKAEARKLVGLFDIISCVDTVELAEAISTEARRQRVTQKIFVEICYTEQFGRRRIGGANAISELEKIFELPNIQVKGLMTNGNPEHLPWSQARKQEFEDMRELFGLARAQFSNHMTELVMGSSDDYEEAVCLGSTLVRASLPL